MWLIRNWQLVGWQLQNYTVNPEMRQPMEGNRLKATFNCRGDDARRYTDLLNSRGWEGSAFHLLGQLLY